MELGYSKGETCNRDGCNGIIQEKDVDGGCSCHTNPPCDYCMYPKSYCSECEWDEKEENDKYQEVQTKYWSDYHKRPEAVADRQRQQEKEKIFTDMYNGKIPVDKYRSRHKGHTHFSQIIYGIHLNESRSEIQEKVKGTFGGRFSRFNDYSFEYIAYTD